MLSNFLKGRAGKRGFLVRLVSCLLLFRSQ